MEETKNTYIILICKHIKKHLEGHEGCGCLNNMKLVLGETILQRCEVN